MSDNDNLLDALSDAADNMNAALKSAASGDQQSTAIAIANAELAVDQVKAIVGTDETPA